MMSVFRALSIVVGTVIGAGVFFKIAAMVAVTQSASLTLLAWAVGGILTICAGLSVAELAAAIPETGGAVKYLERSYGKLVGFLFGWVQVLIYNPKYGSPRNNLCHTSSELAWPTSRLIITYRYCLYFNYHVY